MTTVTPHSSRRQQLWIEAETDCAEVVADNWAEAGATQLQILGPISLLEIKQPTTRLEPTLDYRAGGNLYRRGIQQVKFKFRLEAGGHGAAPEGALTPTDLLTMLGYALGNTSSASVGTTAAGAGSTTAPTVAAGTFADGSLCRIGTNSPRDGRGNGQACAVASCAGGTLTLYNALAALPSDGDKVYAMLLAYPELADPTVSTFRALIHTPNGSWSCHGCFVEELALVQSNPGEHLHWEFTVSGIRWKTITATYPYTAAADAKVGSAVDSCYAHIQTVGTATRAIYALRQFSLEIKLGHKILGGGESDDHTVGDSVARVDPFEAYLNMTLDKDAGGTDFWSAYWNTEEASQVQKRILVNLNSGPGRSTAIHGPNCALIDRPTMEDLDGSNRIKLRWECNVTGVDTNDLTRSPLTIGIS